MKRVNLEKLKPFFDKLHDNRRFILSLSVLVVFITTYMLILPAFTLDADKAKEQGGIDVPGVEETQETDTEDGTGDIIENSDSDNEKDTDANSEQSSPETGSLSYEGKKFNIEVVDEAAVLPESTELKVEEIDEKKDAKEYKNYYEDALKAVQEEKGGDKVSGFSYAKFYDISLLDGKDKINPDETVSVKISYDEAVPVENQKNVKIVHFAEDPDTGEVTPEVLENKAVDLKVEGKEMTETTFEADSFSVYAVVYTVDFEYTEPEGEESGSGDNVSGETKTYMFSIEGESTIKLSELFEALHIKAEPKDAANVEFSNPELIKVTQIEEDWNLESLKPFSTEEKLIVTMEDGAVIEIKVTDDQEITTFQQLKDKGNSVVVIWAYNQNTGKYYALKNDGTTKELDSRSEIDSLPREFLWNYTYKWSNDFWIQSVADNSKFIFMRNPGELIAGESCNIYTAEAGGGAFYLNGYNNRFLWLNDSNAFQDRMGSGTPIHLSEQKALNTFDYKVLSENTGMGTVNIASGTTDTSYKNTVVITATPNSSPVDREGDTKYIFDYWDLNGEKRTDLPQSIAIGGVTFPWTNSTLTAHFKRNPDYEEQDDDQKHGREFTEEEKREMEEWLSQLKSHAVPFNVSATDKTAELYDYENRIYEVDLTAKSSLETFNGEIDLGFILDMSGSMQFPADLKEVKVVGPNESSDGWYVRRNVRTSSNTDLWSYGWRENYWGGIEVSNTDGQVLIGRLNDDNTTKQILNRNKTYYYVADRSGTFTVFHMKYDWSQDNGSGAWVSSDASNGNYKRMDWAGGSYTSNDPRCLYYTIYEASDNGSYTKNAPTTANKDTNRKWYLENSLNSTIDECNDILKKISIARGETDNPDVKIAYNTFYSKVDEKSYNFTSTKGITQDLSFDTSGGTGTDLALLSATGEKYSNEYYNENKDRSTYSQQSYTSSGDDPAGFQWQTANNRYVILITDGAPQAGGKAINNQYVIDAANKLKNEDDVTLITVGLSMKDVRRGSILLYDIASRDETGEPLFFAAEGNELKYVLYDIIRSIIQKANVEGNITDTVNEAFYPVDIISGAPLTNGQVINLKGEKIADSVAGLTDEQKAAGYGVVKENNGTYSITWTSQEIGWEPWHGKFYQKAKEHFLGGNTVRTNDPNKPAVVEATGYKFNPGDPAIAITQDETILDETNYKQSLESPRVNVNELNFTMNDTEWTVYKGETVDPLDELKRLYSKIDVEMVVQKDKNDQVDGNKDNYSYELQYDTSDTRQLHGVRDTFPVEQVFPLTDDDWQTLINGGKVEKTYDAYGQDCPAKYEVTLTKTHDPNSHAATETETYKLEAILKPLHDHLPAGLGGTDPWEYHTGHYLSFDPGLTAGNDDSINNHKINVFVKGLQITKKEQTFTKELTGAEFKLYRTAREGETENIKVINGKDFYPIATLDMTSESVAFIDKVASLRTGEEYYLVETKAPQGYKKLTDPIPVNLSITESYTPKPGDTTTTTRPAAGPYNWTQRATLTIGPSPWVHRTDANGQDITHNALDPDSKTEKAYYDIANDAGEKLPSTGGIGTYVIYITGMALVLGSGAMLIRRKRLSRRG